ncbi:hypothetical protein HK107_01725 [Parvularcula sp. ZS-1/3]|uniref:Uncharacterized protein n=1 Tax=Parvularcula mediterranea TaxID=2732508 RepID=A0A7Y3RKH4_9PROT|nr:hypothetical protein [Parvularcula mediterranea]NNU15042.1 hypothetical protein [Parvularcula mediterranea]
MTAILFLTDQLTAYQTADGSWNRGGSIFGRKGKLKPAAGEILGLISEPGDVVACLPACGTTCQTLRVGASIGRQLTQNDLSAALEAALAKAGRESTAVVSAELSRTEIDGEPMAESPIGQAAGRFEADVTSFLSPLAFLADLERAAAEASLKLTGVMAMEEAAAASLNHQVQDGRTLIVVDRWHTKLIGFSGEHVSASAVVPVGYGHIAGDLAVTFGLDEAKAEEQGLQMVLGRVPPGEEKTSEVALARLEEIASFATEAGKRAGIALDEVSLLGLPVAPPVETAFKKTGTIVRTPGLALDRTDPAIMALSKGAALLSAGTVTRTAATALQLSAPKSKGGVINWLRENF